jgi:hypothetical protein
MLVRAIFWIGVIALLISPANQTGIRAGRIASNGTSAATDFRAALLDRLSVIRGDIEAAERARGEQGD